jgi:hypothetical protein
MTSVVLKPPTEARRRQQDPCSANNYASTGLMHFSNGHVNTCIATRHFPAGHVAHSYTFIVQLGRLLMTIKGDVQEHRGGGGGRTYEDTNTRTHGKGMGEDEQGQSLSLSLALVFALLPRPLATLVTPTTSTLVQDNTSLIPPLCSISHQPIWAGARDDKFTSRSRDPPGPKRRQLARQVGACYVLTNTFPLSSRWVDISNLFSPGRCSTSGVSSSCPSTAATTWYCSLRSTTTTTVNGSPGGGELDDGISPQRRRNTRVAPATLLAGGDRDGATVDTQEAAPYRLSNQSESTTPALLWGMCQVLSSRLRQ